MRHDFCVLKTSMAVACAIIVSSCKGDDESCEPTLDEWCARDGDCDGYRTLDEALESVVEHGGGLSSARICGERVVVTSSDGFVGASFAYELEGGELVGVLGFSDVGSDDACSNSKAAAGEEAACVSSACDLLGLTPESTLEIDACEGELAEPFIASCLEAPPASVAGCEQCACPACFPVLFLCDAFDARVDAGYSLCEGVARSCLQEHCADACEAQIRADIRNN